MSPRYSAVLGLLMLWNFPNFATAQTSSQGEQRDLEPGQRFHCIEGSAGATILEGIRPVLSYQRSTKSLDGQWPRANYVHPLYDLDGEILTEDFPSDHRHHRGIFWAWHQVVGDGQSAGDAWVCRDFQWDVQQLESSVSTNSARISTKVVWKSPAIRDPHGEPLPLVEESAEVIVHAAQPEMRWIDFEIALRALAEDVQIGGSEDEKGYGGFSPRIKLTSDAVFSSTQGDVDPQTTALEAGPWINIADGQRGLAILCHPSNPNYPQPWILRRARSMQNAVYPGREPVPLPTEQPLVLKYRLVVHRGNMTAESLDEIHAQYSRN